MLLKAKSIKQKCKEMQKQISKEAILVLDNHINDVINKIISKQTGKRINEKNIQV